MIKTLLLLLCISTVSFAHPHTFTDVDLNIKVQNDQVQEVQILWNYDDMTSQILLMDYDTNRDGKFDKKESLFFKTEVFDALKKYDYYTHIKVDNKKIPIDNRTKNFFISFENNKFCVNYTVVIKDIPQKSTLDFGFWDPEFYSSFDITSKFVTFSGKKLKFKIEEVMDEIYMGVVLKLKL